MTEVARLQEALKDLWPTLPPKRRAILEQQAAAGHEYLLAVRDGTVGRKKPPVPRELLLLHSLLNDDPDGLLKDAATPQSVITRVGSDGQIYFGDVDYDSTDPKWSYCVWAWMETGPTVPFVNSPVVLKIPDTVTLAILGDWGGNNPPAQQVATAAKALGQVYFVHLGDVYYAGTNENGWVESDYQRENFLDVWPGAAGKSFNLNSNHDMYAHATGYFKTALASPLFSAQAGCSYFALYNSGFRFVGLDTAYFDSDKSGSGFMIGTLGTPGPGTQVQFLHDQAAAAAAAGQQLVLFSHHNGLSMDGKTQFRLWNEVASVLSPLAGKTVIWYWGHEHAAAVYLPQKAATGVTILPRCCGHGCIPWGVATDLASPQVVWSEHTVLGPGSNYLVCNGFATLSFSGSSIEERFYRQDGGISWSSAGTKPQQPPIERVRGIGPVFGQRLREQGVMWTEQLAKMNPGAAAKILGIGMKHAAELVRRAKAREFDKEK